VGGRVVKVEHEGLSHEDGVAALVEHLVVSRATRSLHQQPLAWRYKAR
jgi:hypothetical protein